MYSQPELSPMPRSARMISRPSFQSSRAGNAQTKKRVVAEVPVESGVDSFQHWLSTGHRIPTITYTSAYRRCLLQLSSVPISSVASRLVDFLRVQSISFSFRAKESTVQLRCRTDRCLRFMIYLWQGCTESDVVVEIQRRRGCSILLRQTRVRLFETLKATKHTNATVQAYPSMISRSFCRLRFEGAHGTSLTDSFVGHECRSRESAELVTKCTNMLLSSSSLDNRCLGLDTLLAILETDDVASRTLAHSLFFEKESFHVELLRNSLLQFMSPRTESLKATAEEKYVIVLKVLSVALDTLNAADRKNDTVDQPSNFSLMVLDSCKKEISNACDAPTEAMLAIRVCHGLLKLYPTSEVVLPILSVMDEIVKAYICGRQSNLALEEESLKLLDFIQSNSYG